MSKPKRVLYLITDSGTGGAEKKLLDVLSKLDRSKAEPVGVVVLKSAREMSTRWSVFVPVVHMRMRRWPDPFFLYRLYRAIKRFSPDVIHAFTLHSVLVARLFRCLTGIDVVSAPCLNFRALPVYAHALFRLTQGWDRLVVCESLATKDFLQTKLRHSSKTLIYVPNSIDTSVFKKSSEGRDRIRREWKIGPDEILVGSVGRFHPQKGFDLFIHALAALRNFPRPIRGVLVGDGAQSIELLRMAQEMNVSILFPGLRDDIVDVLSSFDIYVQSSRYEGMSRALMEAMSVSCPIVATAVDGTLDLARDGENMLLCRPDDIHSLSLAIATLSEKKDLRERIANNARKRAEEFSVEMMIRRLETIYEEL